MFTIREFDFKLHHLFVIGILILSFSISFLIRSQALDYGFELNEFDPFFNFRATEYILENGLFEYFSWHDEMSWYPHGRDVTASSQIMLHLTASFTYQLFGGNSNLYDFSIMFPVVFGSLTVVVVFALVRVLAGTTAGLFSALFFSVSVPIVLRGTIGWFKSEPLGLFYGILGLYLFLSGINSKDKRIQLAKVIGGGVFLAFGLASWGGIQFFIIPMGIFILALPFVRKEHNTIIWSVPVFVLSLLLTTLSFERPGTGFVFGLGGLSIIIPTIFLVFCIFIQKKSKPENKLKNSLFLLLAIIFLGFALILINEESNLIPLPSFRYLNAINPFLTTTDPLVDSISEHSTTAISQSFYFHSILMILAASGIWLLLRRKINNSQIRIKNDMTAFILIMGITGVYVSSAFVRLEIFASISIIILASVGLSILSREVFSKNKNSEIDKSLFSKISKISFGVVMCALILSPMVIPADGNWITIVKSPPTILNGGTNFSVATNDWQESLEWIRDNTPKDSVIAAWWDYGYWITTISERKTLADNATIDSERIQNMAKTLLSPPEEGAAKFKEMGADYIVVFVSAEKLDIANEQPLYILGGGGDESKKQWFMRIAQEPVSKFVYPDGISGTDYFWNNTLLGKMIPFTTFTYHNFYTSTQSETYQLDSIAIYEKDIKYPNEGDGVLRLVHASPGFLKENTGPMIGVFVYEINKDYFHTP